MVDDELYHNHAEVLEGRERDDEAVGHMEGIVGGFWIERTLRCLLLYSSDLLPAGKSLPGSEVSACFARVSPDISQ